MALAFASRAGPRSICLLPLRGPSAQLPDQRRAANRSGSSSSSSAGRASFTLSAGSNGHLPDSELTTMALQPRNVLGGPLQCCCTSPRTGYYRDGFCKTDESDHGRHVVCAQVTKEFLEFSKSRGNDLMTPAPHFSFPGLKPGDKWCLCAMRWKEALEAKCAPPVFLKCTHVKALEYVTMESLKQHAVATEDSL